jgi:hypothetical protein
MINNLPILKDWIEDEWKFHLSNNFESLQKIPCSSLRGFVKMFSSVEKYKDLEFLVKFSRRELTEKQYHALFTESLEYKNKGLDNEPISNIKKSLKHTLTQDLDSKVIDSIKALLETIGEAETPKAKDIRKMLKPCLKEKYEAVLKSSGGGDWECYLAENDFPIKLCVDFGGFLVGFRYYLLLPIKDENNFNIQISYESLLGFFYNDMDLLRTDVLESQIGFIFKNVDKIVSLALRYNNALQPTADSGG